MKKTITTMIALLTIAAILFSFAACGNKASEDVPTDDAVIASDATPTEDAANTSDATPVDTAEEAGQNPVMNYVGVYECDRCSITIEADGETDAKISVHWGSSATESSNWTMSGYFDPDTMRINYSDSVRTDLVLDEDTDEATVVYEDGYGRIQFFEDGTLEWQDEQEVDNVRGMIFEFIG